MSRRLAWQAGGPVAAVVCGCFLTLGKQHTCQLDAAPPSQEIDGDGTAALAVREGNGVTPASPPATPPLPALTRRRITRRRTTGAAGAGALGDDMEWTPEGGGSMQQLGRRGTSVRCAEEDASEYQQQGINRRQKNKGWKKRLEEAAEGEGKEGRDTDKAARAARMLKQLQAWETRPPGPCDKYNSIASRFLTWQTRRRECNFAPGNCVFMGRSVTGWCIPEAEAALYEDVMPRRMSDDDDEADEDYAIYSRRRSIEDEEEDGDDDEDDEEREEGQLTYEEEGDFPPSNDPEGPMVETELLQTLVTIIRQEGIEQPVRLLITGSLAEAMTDSLRGGQSGSQELAKELVMEVLTDPHSPDALQHLLRRPDLRASIRQLLHSLVYLPYTKQESHRLLKQQLDWVLLDNKLTQNTLAAACHTLLHAPITHQALLPLLSWTLSPCGPLLSFATDLTSQKLIPLLVPATTDALKGAVQYALEHDYVKELTKDTVKDLLLRVAKMHAVAAAEAARKRQQEEEEEEEREGGREGGREEERLDKGMQERRKDEGADEEKGQGDVDDDVAPPAFGSAG